MGLVISSRLGLNIRSCSPQALSVPVVPFYVVHLHNGVGHIFLMSPHVQESLGQFDKPSTKHVAMRLALYIVISSALLLLLLRLQ